MNDLKEAPVEPRQDLVAVDVLLVGRDGDDEAHVSRHRLQITRGSDVHTVVGTVMSELAGHEGLEGHTYLIGPEINLVARPEEDD